MAFILYIQAWKVNPLCTSRKKKKGKPMICLQAFKKIKPNCFERNICRSDNFRCGRTFVQFISLQFHRLVCKLYLIQTQGMWSKEINNMILS